MNPQSQNSSLDPPADAPNQQALIPLTPLSGVQGSKFEVQGSKFDSSPASTANPPRRSRSKIARLPKATRDKLNCFLRDGLGYEDLLGRLGEEAKDISPRNVSDWHSSPFYQLWLLEQDWLEELRTKQESAFDLLTDFDASKFNAAVLQLAVTRLFGAFRHLDSGSINDKLGGNARIFANLVHALARASRETTNIEKYRDACAKAVTAELKQMNIDRELSDNEYQLLVNKMDRVFKVARRPVAPKPSEGGSAAASSPPPPNNGSH